MRGEITNDTKSNLALSINTDILDAITKIANMSGTSTNLKINSILEKYVLFYRFIEITKDAVIPPALAVPIMNLIGEQEMTKIMSKTVDDVITSLFMHSNIPFTTDNVIEFFIKGPMKWGGTYSSIDQFRDNEGCLNIILEHKKDLLWSKIMATGICNLIKKTGDSVDYTASSNSVTVKILK